MGCFDRVAVLECCCVAAAFYMGHAGAGVVAPDIVEQVLEIAEGFHDPFPVKGFQLLRQ